VKLFVTPLALAELHDAAAFYAEQANLELGRALVTEFERTAQLILSNPLLGAVFSGKFRRCGLRRFPYSIIYQVTPDELRVIALAHQRRRPGYWAHR
jgi:plasmid stabilization system protein ParE